MGEKTRLDILMIDREDATRIHSCTENLELTFNSLEDAIDFTKKVRKELSNKFNRFRFIIEEIE